MKRFFETSNYIHFSPKCCKCFHLGLASKHLELRPRRKKGHAMTWDRTQDPFRWFDEIFLVDEFQISWSDSSEIRVQSLASRLPLLIILRIPSSRCLWSLAATLAQTYSYLFAFHHFGWLQNLHDWNKTFKEEKQRQLLSVSCPLKISNEVSWPCHGKGGANAVERLWPLASCPQTVYKEGKDFLTWPMRLVIVEFWWLLNLGAYDNYAVPSISFLEAWQEPSSLVPTGVLPKISNW